MMCATLLIYMDSTGMTVWMWIQSLSHYWKYQGSMLPSFPWWFPFYHSLQDSKTLKKKRNTRLTVNKDHVYWIQVITWRQRMDVCLLVESGLCLSFRWVVEAAPWRPGTLAFHSSSSGSRTAQSWRETWLRVDGGGADRWHGAESGAFNYISIWTLVELTDQWSDLTPDPAVPLSSVKCFNLFQLFLLVYSPQLDFFGLLSPFFPATAGSWFQPQSSDKLTLLCFPHFNDRGHSDTLGS